MARARRRRWLWILVLLVLVAAVVLFCRTAPPPPPPPVEAPDAPRPEAPDRIPFSFRTAKKHLRDIHAAHPVTVYCACRFTAEQTLDPESCGFSSSKYGARRFRVEWEHAAPASRLGYTREAWRKGHPRCVTNDGQPYRGRRCAQRVDRLYKLAESDMYNLFPALGAVNAIRSDHAYGDVPGEARRFGSCDVEDTGRTFEPRPAARGELARAHLYMDWAYPTLKVLDDEARARMRAWSAADPVDDWECARAAAIAALQKNDNPFVRDPCRARTR